MISYEWLLSISVFNQALIDFSFFENYLNSIKIIVADIIITMFR